MNQIKMGDRPFHRHPRHWMWAVPGEVGLSLGKAVPFSQRHFFRRDSSAVSCRQEHSLKLKTSFWSRGRDTQGIFLGFSPTLTGGQRTFWWNKITTCCPPPQKYILIHSVVSPGFCKSFCKNYFQFGAFLHSKTFLSNNVLFNIFWPSSPVCSLILHAIMIKCNT